MIIKIKYKIDKPSELIIIKYNIELLSDNNNN